MRVLLLRGFSLFNSPSFAFKVILSVGIIDGRLVSSDEKKLLKTASCSGGCLALIARRPLAEGLRNVYQMLYQRLPLENSGPH